MERWCGKTALVTGASAGIGFAVAEDFAKAGLTVIACARNISTIEELAKSCTAKGKIIAIKCDITKEEEILKLFKTIEEKYKYVDILVNNAGLGHADDLLTGKTEKWREMIDLNVLGLSICSREALRLMDKNKVDDGHIVNINSIGGHYIFPNAPMYHFYAGTKHMVLALTQALNAELRAKKSKIRVSTISPGAVETKFNDTMAKTTELKAAVDAWITFPQLSAKDISAAVLYAVGAPPHVAIYEVIIMPTEQGAPS